MYATDAGHVVIARLGDQYAAPSRLYRSGSLEYRVPSFAGTTSAHVMAPSRTFQANKCLPSLPPKLLATLQLRQQAQVAQWMVRADGEHQMQ